MLFRVSGGEWTHIGDMNELNFDLIWERPGIAESYPDKYAAAARKLYGRLPRPKRRGGCELLRTEQISHARGP